MFSSAPMQPTSVRLNSKAYCRAIRGYGRLFAIIKSRIPNRTTSGLRTLCCRLAVWIPWSSLRRSAELQFITLDQSRFLVRIDFERDSVQISVSETIAADGTPFAP